jgi:hypothetical protein
MQIKCACGQFYTVPDHAGGTTCVCQNCKQQIAIPVLCPTLSQGTVRPIILKVAGSLVLVGGVVLIFFSLFGRNPDPRGYLFCSFVAIIGLVLVGFGIAMDRKK